MADRTGNGSIVYASSVAECTVEEDFRYGNPSQLLIGND